MYEGIELHYLRMHPNLIVSKVYIP